jgi:hypothetical protein
MAQDHTAIFTLATLLVWCVSFLFLCLIFSHRIALIFYDPFGHYSYINQQATLLVLDNLIGRPYAFLLRLNL